jgi:hypothetical protein
VPVLHDADPVPHHPSVIFVPHHQRAGPALQRLCHAVAVGLSGHKDHRSTHCPPGIENDCR